MCSLDSSGRKQAGNKVGKENACGPQETRIASRMPGPVKRSKGGGYRQDISQIYVLKNQAQEFLHPGSEGWSSLQGRTDGFREGRLQNTNTS